MPTLLLATKDERGGRCSCEIYIDNDTSIMCCPNIRENEWNKHKCTLLVSGNTRGRILLQLAGILALESEGMLRSMDMDLKRTLVQWARQYGEM